MMEPISDDETSNHGSHRLGESVGPERRRMNYSGTVNFGGRGGGGMVEMNGFSTIAAVPQTRENINPSAAASVNVSSADFTNSQNQGDQYAGHAHTAGNYLEGNQPCGGNGEGSRYEKDTKSESGNQESNPEYFRTVSSLARYSPCNEDISEDDDDDESQPLSEEYIRNGICLVPALPRSDDMEESGNRSEISNSEHADSGNGPVASRVSPHSDSDIDIESVSQKSNSVYVRNGEGLTSPRSSITDDEVTNIITHASPEYCTTASNGEGLNQNPQYIEVMSGPGDGNQALGPGYDSGGGGQFNQHPQYIEYVTVPVDGPCQALGSEYDSNGICLVSSQQYDNNMNGVPQAQYDNNMNGVPQAQYDNNMNGVPQAQYNNQLPTRSEYSKNAPVSSMPFGQTTSQVGNVNFEYFEPISPAAHPSYNVAVFQAESGNQPSSSGYYPNTWNSVPPSFLTPRNQTVTLAGNGSQRSDYEYYSAPQGPTRLYPHDPGPHHNSFPMSQQPFHDDSHRSAFAQGQASAHGTKRSSQGSLTPQPIPKRPRRKYTKIEELTALLHTTSSSSNGAPVASTSTWVPPSALNPNATGAAQTQTGDQSGDSGGSEIQRIRFTENPGAITVSLPGGAPFLKVPLMSAITSTVTVERGEKEKVPKSKSKPRTVVYRSESYMLKKSGLPVAQPLPATKDRVDNSDNEEISTRGQHGIRKRPPQTPSETNTSKSQPEPPKQRKKRIYNSGTIEDEDGPKKPPTMAKKEELDQSKKLKLKIRKDKMKCKTKKVKVRSQATPEPGSSSGKIKKKGVPVLKDGIRKRKPLRTKRERSSSVEFLLEVPRSRSTEPKDQTEGLDLSLDSCPGSNQVEGAGLDMSSSLQSDSVVQRQANLDMPDIFNFQSDTSRTEESISNIADDSTEVQSSENVDDDGDNVEGQRASNISEANVEVQIGINTGNDTVDDVDDVQGGTTIPDESAEVQTAANSTNDNVDIQSAGAQSPPSNKGDDAFAEVHSSTNESSPDILIILEKEKAEKRPGIPKAQKKQNILNTPKSNSCSSEAVSTTCSPNSPCSPFSPISSSEADEFDEIVENLSANKSHQIISNPPEEPGEKEKVSEKNSPPPLVSPVVPSSSSDNNQGVISVIVNNPIPKEPVPPPVPPVKYVGVIVHTSRYKPSQPKPKPSNIESGSGGETILATQDQIVDKIVQNELPNTKSSTLEQPQNNVQVRHVNSTCNEGSGSQSRNNDEFHATREIATSRPRPALPQMEQDQDNDSRNGRVIRNATTSNRMPVLANAPDNSNRVTIIDSINRSVHLRMRQPVHATNYIRYNIVSVPPAHQRKSNNFTDLYGDCSFILDHSTGPFCHLHQLFSATTLPRRFHHDPFEYLKEMYRSHIAAAIEAGTTGITNRCDQPRDFSRSRTPAIRARGNPRISGNSFGGMSNAAKSTATVQARDDSRLRPLGRIREMDENGNITVKRVAHRLIADRPAFPVSALCQVDRECPPNKSSPDDNNPPSPKRGRPKATKSDDANVTPPKRGRPKKSDDDNPPKRGRPRKADDDDNPPKRGRPRKSDDDTPVKRPGKKPKENATRQKVRGIYKRLQKDVTKIYKLGPASNSNNISEVKSNESSLSVPFPIEKRLRPRRGESTPVQKIPLEEEMEEITSDSDDDSLVIEEATSPDKEIAKVADVIPNDENNETDKLQSDSNTQQSASSCSDNDDEDILNIHADGDIDLF